jgi:Protein of unknown function (DUF3016)
VTTAARRLCVLTVLLLAGCAATKSPEGSVSHVSVSFIEPEKFTDARRSDLDPTSSGILRDLEKFLIDTGGRYVPEDMTLNIRVTNIDLAGDFELFRGPQADQVRINRGLYPPRLTLEFELLDRAAKVVKTGRRELTDIDYQSRAVYPQDDYLRYEKEILRDWIRTEFGDLKNRMAG